MFKVLSQNTRNYSLLSQNWVQSNGRLVQNHQFRLVHQSTCKRNTTLLATTQLHDVPFASWQLQQILKDLEAFTYAFVIHSVDTAKVENRLFDC